MKKKIIGILVTLTLITTSFISTALAEGGSTPPSGSPPDKPPEGFMGGAPSDSSHSGSADITYTGDTEYNADGSYKETSYTSTTGGENALLATSGTITLDGISVTKSGDESSESSDFYGTNAAILATDEAVVEITDATIETDGTHANAVFAYGSGQITISDSTIHTSSNNSGGIMVTGGGTLVSNNNTVTTEGNSSAAIRSDRGGGIMTVNGGTYTTNGQGSPAIYSTADITVNEAELISTSSEGIVVEGKNSVTLNNVTLTDSNTSLNGNSETYKNIFIYQSMSGDADEGTASFTANDSTITTKNGDVFYVTNTSCIITLSGNTFVTESDGAFLMAEGAAWGSKGSNGGDVTLILNDQTVSGDIVIDEISSLDMTLDDSVYEGTINGSNDSEDITVTLSADSKLILTGDSYITALANEDETNSNIYFNGYTLYVNGKAVDGNSEEVSTDIEESTVAETASSSAAAEENSKITDETDDSEENSTLSVVKYLPYIIGGTAVLATIIFLISKFKH